MPTATPPPPFDYITAQPYRSLLEADFEEMQLCLRAGAWKAAMVLAGSLIEAVLIEHLEWLSGPGDEKRLRKMMLADAITSCESLGEINQTTAKLCSAVKDYRNLIHPGKVVRDSVAAPDQSNAMIVTALVGRITQEISATRSARSGLTAEQLLRKVERDSGSIPILPHLLKQVRTQEKARLLLDVLPTAYTLHSAYDDFEGIDGALLNRISTAYRLALNESPEHAKTVSQQFHSLILSGDSAEILRHSEAFFRAPDIAHLEEEERAVVVDYLIGNVAPRQDGEDYSQTIGIAPFLTTANFPHFVAPVLRHALANQPSKSAKSYLALELISLSPDVKEHAKKHLLRLARLYEQRNSVESAKELREFADWLDLPF